MRFKPMPGGLVVLRINAVSDHMKVSPWESSVDVSHETDELHGSPAALDPGHGGVCSSFESCQQRLFDFMITGSAALFLDPGRLTRIDLAGSFEAGLFSDPEYYCFVGRIQIDTGNVDQFGLKV